MEKYSVILLAFILTSPAFAEPLLMEEPKPVSKTAADDGLVSLTDEEEENINTKDEEAEDSVAGAIPAAENAAEEAAAKAEPEAEPEPKPIEYVPNPSNFSADFMGALYECQSARERQNLAGVEEIAITGKVNGKCQLRYDDFVLNIPTELLPNIHSMTDIRQLLLNNDFTTYLPQYEYAGLLQELNLCSKSGSGHNAYLHRRTNNDIAITKGLTSKVENGGCTIRLLNQLSMNDSFKDYSVVCRIPANDMQLILEAYANLLQEQNPDTAELKKADEETLFRLQQVGYCQKPKI